LASEWDITQHTKLRVCLRGLGAAAPVADPVVLLLLLLLLLLLSSKQSRASTKSLLREGDEAACRKKDRTGRVRVARQTNTRVEVEVMRYRKAGA
jgi:hypothetical protein